MEVWNMIKEKPQEIEVKFTSDNTTWFNNCTSNDDIHMITDSDFGLIIQELGDSRPMLIEGKTRNDVNHSKHEAGVLRSYYY